MSKNGSLVNTQPFPGTRRIAVDRDAASQGKPCIFLLDAPDKPRVARVQIHCPCCDKVAAEVRWSGSTRDAPTVWVEYGEHQKITTFKSDGGI